MKIEKKRWEDWEITYLFETTTKGFQYCHLNPFPNGKILDMTKLKAFAEDKLMVPKMTISIFDRVENTVGKGENAGYQHFLLFPLCFPKASSLGLLKVRI